MQLIPKCEPKLQDINRSLLIIEVNCQVAIYCCAARGHALAVCHLLALLVRQTSSAQRNNNCQKFKNLRVLRQSPFARKALFITGRAGPLACAAAADRLRP